jgi:hypothetical protein
MEIKNLGQLLQHLATKAGIDSKDQNLINLLSSSELTKITLHSDLVKGFDENLLSVEAATDNHPVIGPKYKALALNPFDQKMQAIMDELGLSDEDKAELKGVRSSYERFEKLGAKLKELTTKKDNADTAKDKNALQKQIDELLGKLQAEKKAFEEQLQVEKAGRITDKINFEKRSLYGAVKTIYDSLDPSIRATSLDAVISKALQDKDAEFAYDDQGNFLIRKKDGTNLVGANHTKYTPQAFIDEVLAQNRILAVNPASNGTKTEQTTQVADGKDGQPVNGTNQSVAAMNMEAIRALQGDQQ